MQHCSVWMQAPFNMLVVQLPAMLICSLGCAVHRGTDIPFPVLCSVGIKPPGIEVRFKDIFIETSVYTNVSRNLPSILNAYRGAVEVSSSDIQFLDSKLAHQETSRVVCTWCWLWAGLGRLCFMISTEAQKVYCRLSNSSHTAVSWKLVVLNICSKIGCCLASQCSAALTLLSHA